MARVSTKELNMKKHHVIENVSIENGVLSLVVDGKEIKRDLKDISNIQASASEDELSEFEITPSGYGIHWPLIDEDISVDGLLGIVHKPGVDRKSA
jgi:hypothetical protein